MHHIELINDYIQKRGYKSYCEIGVENPDNCFNHIVCDHKVSVDPYFPTPYMDQERSDLMASKVTHRMTSDEFFAKNTEKFDLIFIDALHTEDQCDLDVSNAINALNPFGCIILHDSLPEDEYIQSDEAFEHGHPWTGTVWKTVRKLINTNDYKVKVYFHDYGVAVIEALDSDSGVLRPYTPVKSNLEYSKDFSLVDMNLEYSFLNDDFKVSYFTPAYKSLYLRDVYNSLAAQTDPRWDWVVLDDSPANYSGVFDEIQNLINTTHDHRIKYYRMMPNSGGFIGRVKHRAVSLCEGVLVAELDHDDEIADITTELLLKVHLQKNSDFYYSNTYAYTLENGVPHVVEYPDGFAMGYGSYRHCDDIYIRSLDMHVSDKYSVDPNINPKTIRHIVGVPNHIRVWKRSFIDSIGSYNVNLPHCDDYELIVRTFVAGGRITKLDKGLYVQKMHTSNSQYDRLDDIQTYVKAISNYYHKAIAERFQEFFTGSPDLNTDGLIYDYVYSHNHHACLDTCFVYPPEELQDIHVNDIVSLEEIDQLLKH